ncbi:HD domain-containing protein [Nocardia sp. CDC159]|uniref:HD domain-containing protein n=1 Tax=Nocardia pulmonis TaxID=2951408 RepID=A0A9X2E5B5_9NOCA|nr:MULTISPECIES: HD domain-containing protein [Nocardia]MCM6773916.1 HD domain-containing protein [Nocardia pulmonis]MCM6786803.1 HD domain-containing protein [Nocardia sp. CDC159]
MVDDELRLADLTLPETNAARAAWVVAGEYCSPALLNHSVRSYVWAVALARAERIEFDAELLYVAAVLHDIGLVVEFDSHTLPFEEAGGHVAGVFAAGAGWSVQRRRRLLEIIVRHMWSEVDPAADPEGYLLEASTGVDISGRGVDRIGAGLRAEVLARWPRLDLAQEFIGRFDEQARRKPGCAAAAAVRGGIAERIRRNPLDEPENFARIGR